MWAMEVTVATKEKPVVKNVLVVVDHFTRYVQAYVTRNQTTYTTAKKLYNEYFSCLGFPNGSCQTREPGLPER